MLVVHQIASVSAKSRPCARSAASRARQGEQSARVHHAASHRCRAHALCRERAGRPQCSSRSGCARPLAPRAGGRHFMQNARRRASTRPKRRAARNPCAPVAATAKSAVDGTSTSRPIAARVLQERARLYGPRSRAASGFYAGGSRSGSWSAQDESDRSSAGSRARGHRCVEPREERRTRRGRPSESTSKSSSSSFELGLVERSAGTPCASWRSSSRRRKTGWQRRTRIAREAPGSPPQAVGQPPRSLAAFSRSAPAAFARRHRPACAAERRSRRAAAAADRARPAGSCAPRAPPRTIGSGALRDTLKELVARSQLAACLYRVTGRRSTRP